MSENTSSEFKKLQKNKDAFFPWIDMVEAPKQVEVPVNIRISSFFLQFPFGN